MGKAIWIDLATPKSVMFFRKIIEKLNQRGVDTFVTSRQGDDYTETTELLDLYEIKYRSVGKFGGGQLKGKLHASLLRQMDFMETIAGMDAECGCTAQKVEKLVCLCSVDANRVAFGLKIPIVNFYDIPLSDYTSNFLKALPQARLTLPLSAHVFKPFMVPDDIFTRFSLEKAQVYSYEFIDPVLWLCDFKPDINIYEGILKSIGADSKKPVIVVREEEYKSSYVDKQYPLLYKALPEIYKKTEANIIIVPRYELDYLKTLFPFAYVLENKIKIQHLLAYCDLFIGGGGTINVESTFFGTPTVSTRSFVSHYDKFLMDVGLMKWVSSESQLIETVLNSLGKRKEALSEQFYDRQVEQALCFSERFISWLISGNDERFDGIC
ncbi:MAG: DUF354 domain-containing protein [Nitrospirae bacterium]|nr:DUF354 domain-containing protein [Nitrospirota bacterium]MBF0534359.1 DUF354 domain-containing protein [Nitrospirota bacterium]MBF0615660.1 DUF354 domain-containing protein [Nitrospirota bacterium]